MDMTPAARVALTSIYRPPLARLVIRTAGALIVVGAVLAFITLQGVIEPRAVALTAAVMGALFLAVVALIVRTARRARLVVGPDGIDCSAPPLHLVATWADVVAIIDVLAGAESGPAILFGRDVSTAGGGIAAVARVASFADAPIADSADRRRMLPLTPFADPVDPLLDDLRRFIPDIVERYEASHG